jgi:hypothetical protein
VSRAADQDRSDERATAPVTTGNAVVDQVLASLQGLDERPTSEHVAVFESADDRLRDALSTAALSTAGNAPRDSA